MVVVRTEINNTPMIILDEWPVPVDITYLNEYETNNLNLQNIYKL
jgi:hypothetical protein